MSPLKTHECLLQFPRLRPELPTPLYHQMFIVLREMIQRGELPIGAVLPGEQDLAELCDVSRITVKRALNELGKSGLVSRRRGIGTVVLPNPQFPVVKGQFDGVGESIRQMGMSSETTPLDFSDMLATSEIASRLALPANAKVQRSVWRRMIEGQPFSHVESFIPQDIASRFSRKDLELYPIPVLLKRAGVGALHADQWISAVSAEPEIAAILDVPVGYPVLRIERLLRDAIGRPLQLVYCHFRSDRFQWHIRSEGSHYGDVVHPGAESPAAPADAIAAEPGGDSRPQARRKSTAVTGTKSASRLRRAAAR